MKKRQEYRPRRAARFQTPIEQVAEQTYKTLVIDGSVQSNVSRRSSTILHPIRRPLFPETRATVQAITGLTPVSLYLFNEASGDLTDNSSNDHLPVVGSPTFQYAGPEPRKGISYPTSAAHALDAHDYGELSFVVSFVYRNVTSTSNVGLAGRANDSEVGWMVHHSAGSPGSFVLHIKDTESNTADVTVSDVNATTGFTFISIQIDRNSEVARMRVMPLDGQMLTSSESLSTVHSISDAGQTFGFGDLTNDVVGGAAFFWAAIFTETEAEGSDVLGNLHYSLGWE